MAEARRTLVKSPPELWALISDPGCLGKHLEAFGEIRITRVEPETTVAWEGDRACGTVELEASGWGTKVRLTADAVEVDEPAPEPEPEPVVAEEEPPVAEEPVVEEPPASIVELPPVEDAPEKRRGFLARWFGRRGELRVTTVSPEPPVAEEPAVVEEVVEEPVAEVVEEPAPVEEPEAAGEIRVARLGDEEAARVLNEMLDTLGAAHHRPFSRS